MERTSYAASEKQCYFYSLPTSILYGDEKRIKCMVKNKIVVPRASKQLIFRGKNIVYFQNVYFIE